jgi:hypothetical protein
MMDDTQSHMCAVLTGDIVNSSMLDAQERQNLFAAFPELSRMLRQRYPDEFRYNISNFRGDGWQLILNQPRKLLEICLFIRTYLRFAISEKEIDSRVGIGVGKVDFVPAGNVSAGYGSAYTVSGHLLEGLASNQRMALGFDTDQQPFIHATASTLVELIDAIITSWGSSQCQAVFWALQGLTQTQIAERWLPAPIKQPSVSNNLNRSAWATIRKTLAFFEEVIDRLAEREAGE